MSVEPMQGSPPVAKPRRSGQPAAAEAPGPALRLNDRWAVFLALAAAAVGVRVLGMGAVPLEASEAGEALAAWAFVRGEAGVPLGASPLLFTANVLAFGLAAASDVTARWLPWLSGALLTAVPFLLWRRLKLGGAFWAGLMLAFSATALYFGRHLNGDALGATLATLAWAAALADGGEGRGRRLWLTAAALALALTAGSAAYTVLLAVGSWAALERLLGPRLTGEAGLGRWWAALREQPARTRQALGLGGLVFLLAATAFTLRWVGLGLTADLLAGWFTRFFQPGSYPLGWLPWLLLLQEPLIVLTGLAGLALAVRRRDRFGLGLGWWAGLALLATLLSAGRHPADLLTVLAPLALLGGQALHALVDRLRAQGQAAVEGMYLALGAVLLIYGYIELSAYARLADTRYLLFSGMAVVLCLGLTVLWWAWHGLARALRGLALLALLGASLASLSAAGNLNFQHEVNRLQGMVAEETTPGMRDLVAWLQRLSAQRHTDPKELSLLVVGYDRPLLRWYTREFRHVRWTPGLAEPPAETAVLAPVQRELPLGDTFTGQDFEILRRGLPTGWQGWASTRWLLYRKPPAMQLEKELLVLWVKQTP
ncbi:MAG: hypothetical protein GX605_05780 [Chloroflexi bacterium]|nr:hypothetical protein [Chloroflexota bacterium]